MSNLKEPLMKDQFIERKVLTPAPSNSKKLFTPFAICFFLFIYYLVAERNPSCTCSTPWTEKQITGNREYKKYLVYTEHCKIPYFEPIGDQFKNNSGHSRSFDCSEHRRLTVVTYNKKLNRHILRVRDELIPHYIGMNGSISCCYQSITRGNSRKQPDDAIAISHCLAIRESTVLGQHDEFVRVTCKDNRNNEVYSDVHTVIPVRIDLQERLEYWRKMKLKRTPNILLIGISGISRMNFHRTMPKTWKYIVENLWFTLDGYNKVDYDTFANLMAILTGYNSQSANKMCNPRIVGKLDHCPFIWQDYQKVGYVTAYAEDDTFGSTFNYKKKGFNGPPTDFYMRPAVLARFHYVKRRGKCLGYKHRAEYVLDYLVNLVKTFRNDPLFGLFWTNSFANNKFRDAEEIDEQFVDHFNQLEHLGVMNKSIIVFMGDYGIMVNATRYFQFSHLEERLPMIHVWLPKWFRSEYPEFVRGLRINQGRLTSPYDLHVTLEHILLTSGRTIHSPDGSLDSPSSQSLFHPIPINRTCNDIGIEDHWCACSSASSVNEASPDVQVVTQKVIDQINEMIKSFSNDTQLCEELHLKQVLDARKTILHSNKRIKSKAEYEIQFRTSPGDAVFECVAQYNPITNWFAIKGPIGRVNFDEDSSRCVDDYLMKLYCFCK